jgi:HEAT repeat protein
MDEVDKLIVKLGDPEPSVRMKAARALGKIGDERAIPALIEALNDRINSVQSDAFEINSVQSEAVDALVKIGKPAIPALIELPKDEHWYSAKWTGEASAAEALARIGVNGEQFGTILKMLTKGRTQEEKIWAAAVLCYMAEANPRSIEVVKAVPALTKAAKNENQYLQSWAVGALGKIKDARAVPALIKALKDTDEYVRSDAAEALGKIKDARAVPALIKALKDKNMFVRRGVILALFEIGKPAVPSLVKAVKDENKYMSAHAAIVLGMARDARAVPALIETLEAGYLKDDAAEQLGKIAKAKSRNDAVAKAVPALTRALCDEDRTVRALAAHALENILENSETIVKVNEFEVRLQEGFDHAKKHLKKDEVVGIEMQISKLRIAAAQKKNKLAHKRDILLDDIPKPPRRGGGTYQSLRRPFMASL